MVQSRRERLREATLTEIKTIARRQMAREGTAGLSLRGISEEMGMSPTALYRYYSNRDALVTALIVEAFDSLGDWLVAADQGQPQQDYAARLRATSLAYREWALAQPTDHNLIYGNPIPGYHAPPEVTTPAARRSTRAFQFIFQEAWQAGRLKLPPEYATLPAGLKDYLTGWLPNLGSDLPAAVFAMGLIMWGQLQGLVIQELNGHLHAQVGDPGLLYEAAVDAMHARLGL